MSRMTSMREWATKVWEHPGTYGAIQTGVTAATAGLAGAVAGGAGAYATDRDVQLATKTGGLVGAMTGLGLNMLSRGHAGWGAYTAFEKAGGNLGGFIKNAWATKGAATNESFQKMGLLGFQGTGHGAMFGGLAGLGYATLRSNKPMDRRLDSATMEQKLAYFRQRKQALGN